MGWPSTASIKPAGGCCAAPWSWTASSSIVCAAWRKTVSASASSAWRTPLVLTPDYLKDSCDTFPLEFIEIKQRHVTILGNDYFDSLSFRDSDVRLQCERELKVILLGMHQGLLASSGHERTLLDVTGQLIEHLIRTLRGLLWLKGQRDPGSTPQVVEATEQLIGRKLAGVRRLLHGDESTTWDAFCELYANVQDLGQYVNAD